MGVGNPPTGRKGKLRERAPSIPCKAGSNPGERVLFLSHRKRACVLWVWPRPRSVIHPTSPGTGDNRPRGMPGKGPTAATPQLRGGCLRHAARPQGCKGRRGFRIRIRNTRVARGNGTSRTWLGRPRTPGNGDSHLLPGPLAAHRRRPRALPSPPDPGSCCPAVLTLPSIMVTTSGKPPITFPRSATRKGVSGERPPRGDAPCRPPLTPRWTVDMVGPSLAWGEGQVCTGEGGEWCTPRPQGEAELRSGQGVRGVWRGQRGSEVA